MKRYSTSQIKATMRYYLTVAKMVLIKKTRNKRPWSGKSSSLLSSKEWVENIGAIVLRFFSSSTCDSKFACSTWVYSPWRQREKSAGSHGMLPRTRTRWGNSTSHITRPELTLMGVSWQGSWEIIGWLREEKTSSVHKTIFSFLHYLS